MFVYLVGSTVGSLLFAVILHFWQKRERDAWLAKADARIVEAVLQKLAEDRATRDAATVKSVADIRAAGDAAKAGDTVDAANGIIAGGK